MNPIAIAVLVALGISLLGNVALFRMHSSDQQKIATEHSAFIQSQAAGKECSDGVDKLRTESDARQKSADIAIRAAQSKARLSQAKAQGTLATAPSNPGDLCASLDKLNRTKINERSGKGIQP